MAECSGVTTEQCIGLHCYKAVHATTRPPDFCPPAETCRDGREHTAEVHDRDWAAHLLVSTTPRYDAHGRLIGSVACFRRCHGEQAGGERRAAGSSKYSTWPTTARNSFGTVRETCQFRPDCTSTSRHRLGPDTGRDPRAGPRTSFSAQADGTVYLRVVRKAMTEGRSPISAFQDRRYFTNMDKSFASTAFPWRASRWATVAGISPGASGPSRRCGRRPRSCPAPTRTWSSSPTWPRTTCKSRCGWSPATWTCSGNATKGGSTTRPTSTSPTPWTGPRGCRR